jgi:pilus assembly protein CpaE
MYRIVFATRDATIAERVSHAIERTASTVRVDPESTALQDALRRMEPDLLVLDADVATGTGAAFPGCARAVQELRPGLRYVALGDESNATTVLMAVRAGSADFIGRESAEEEIAAQLVAVLRQADRRTRTDAGRLSVVVSGRPNEGESLFAINLAVLLAQRHRDDVVLIDCALPASETDVALDLELSYILRDAVQDVARMDRTLLTSTLARHKASGLYVLPLSLAIENVRDVQANNLVALIGILRGLFGEVVLNIGGFRHSSLLRQFCEGATATFVYVTQSFSSVRACHGVLEQGELGRHDRAQMVLVVGDYDSAIQLTDRQIADTLEMPRTLRMPAARADLLNGLNNGQTMPELAPRSPYIAGLARAIEMRAIDMRAIEMRTIDVRSGDAAAAGAAAVGARGAARAGGMRGTRAWVAGAARSLLARIVPSLS